MKIELFMHHGLTPALSLLPPRMDTPEARALVLAICLQESGGLYNRLQIGGGPARGYPQFEKGAKAKPGGVYALLNHPTSPDPEISAAFVMANLVRMGLGYVSGPTKSGGRKVTASDGSTITIFPTYLAPAALSQN
jgi:hypothetical protein